MPKNSVYVLDATTLISLKQIAAAGNDIRYLDALIAPGKMVITSTVRAEAAGKPAYKADALLDQWLSRQEQLGRLQEIQTPNYPAGPKNSGDQSIRAIVPNLANMYGSNDVFIITDDGGLTTSHGGAGRVYDTNRFITENWTNGAITTTEYAYAVQGRLVQGSPNQLITPGTEFTGSNGVRFKYGPAGAEITDRTGIKHQFGLKQTFQIDDLTGTVRVGSSNPSRCFVKGTPILLGNGSYKPIEEIVPGDNVIAFDGASDHRFTDKALRKVTKIFRSKTTSLVRIGDLYCTPGHVFLDGSHLLGQGEHFDTIGSILKKDGSIVKVDGAMIRARTGTGVNSLEDIPLKVTFFEKDDHLTTFVKRSARVRAGIPVPMMKSSDCVIKPATTLADHLESNNVRILDDGRVMTSENKIYDSIEWVSESTPFDIRDAENWIIEVDGQPYTPNWIKNLTIEDELQNIELAESLRR